MQCAGFDINRRSTNFKSDKVRCLKRSEMTQLPISQQEKQIGENECADSFVTDEINKNTGEEVKPRLLLPASSATSIK